MITFDEKEHTYKINGEKVLCVSNIIQMITDPENKISSVPQDILLSAQQRGTFIHKGIEDHFAKRTVILESEEYTDASDLIDIISFLKNTDIQKIKAEEVLSYKNLLCGTVDFIGKYEGKKTIIDWKTNKNSKGILQRKDFIKWGLQIHLYNYLIQDSAISGIPKTLGKKVFHFPSDSKYVYIYDFDSGEYALFAKLIIDFLEETKDDIEKTKPKTVKKLKYLQECFKEMKRNTKANYIKKEYNITEDEEFEL